MARKSNRERYVEALSRIICSLIGENGLTRQEALLVCKCFRDDAASRRPPTEKVEALEREAVGSPPIPDYIKLALDGEGQLPEPLEQVCESPTKTIVAAMKPRLKVASPKPKINPEVEYQTPWVKVKNLNGILIRYDDANGQRIPEAFWP